MIRRQHASSELLNHAWFLRFKMIFTMMEMGTSTLKRLVSDSYFEIPLFSPTILTHLVDIDCEE